MEPIDYRNATFEELKSRLNETRIKVYHALQTHGPCTTRQLAEKSGIDILSVRPRVTDLMQLGYAELAFIEKAVGEKPGRSLRRHEGIYRALSDAEAFKLFSQHQAEARREQQPCLSI
jgi:DNA-binding MarR family transcriptional regulator